MIRPIDIRLNAAHPELPLLEAVTYTGSPSTVLIRGVPPNCGRWAITAVFVAASFPDGSTTTRAAVQSANGVWVATLPATATSGRTANGIRVLADGIDENGEAVTGYILGVADFAVASLDVTPAPEPGGTSYQMLYFDEVPSTLRKGDVTKIDGVLKFYNGTAWEPFAAPITLDDAVTPSSANGVKSSGIWSAIWGAATTAFSSLYDWCVNQLAGKLSSSSAAPAFDATRTAQTKYNQNEIVSKDGVVYQCTNASGHYGAWNASNWEAKPVSDLFLPLTGGEVNGDLIVDGRVDISSFFSITKIIATGFVFIGRINNVEHRATLPLSNVFDSSIFTIAFLQNIAPDYNATSIYELNNLCVHNGRLYRCTTAITTAEAWTAAHWTQATAEDVLAALRTAIAGKADVSAIPYDLVEKTIENGAVTLDDRASNSVTISTTLSPNTLTINFPTAPTGKLRDFAMRLNIAAGVTAPEIAWPQGVTLENNGGEVPEIADGGTGGSSTILYFSETENNGTTAKFIVKSETLTAITQA